MHVSGTSVSAMFKDRCRPWSERLSGKNTISKGPGNIESQSLQAWSRNLGLPTILRTPWQCCAGTPDTCCTIPLLVEAALV
jgi:hypothetical protein